MVQLTAQVYREMIEYCIAELPNEACGLLSSRDGVVITCWPVLNRDNSPVSFRMDEGEVEAVLETIQQSGEQLAAVFHSHPTATATPSPYDQEHFLLSCSYMIVSLLHHRPRVRSYLPDSLHPRKLVPERILFARTLHMESFEP